MSVAAETPLVPIERVRVLADGLDHPEGVTWGPDDHVYAGGEAGQVYRIDPATGATETIGDSGGFTLGLAHDAAARTYVCDPVARGIRRFDGQGGVELYAAGGPGEEVAGCNHCAFDARGNLYFSDSGHWKQDDGRLYRAAPGGGVAELWCRELRTVPNGVCVGPGEEHLYVAMTLGPGRISRVEIRADGSAGAVEDYALLPGTLPDGLAFDETGDLYVVTYRPESVWVIRAGSRRVELVAHDPEGQALASPTNLAFGHVGGEPRLYAANIGRWHVAELPAAAPGLPLAYPAIGEETA